MRDITAAFIVLFCMLLPKSIAGQDLKMKQIDAISGANFLFIQSTLPELRKNNLDIKAYAITVLEDSTSVYVLFTDPSAPKSERGSAGIVPIFEVEMTKTGSVVGSHFAR